MAYMTYRKPIKKSKKRKKRKKRKFRRDKKPNLTYQGFSHRQHKPISVMYSGRGFGDKLLAAFLSLILRDNGLEAYRKKGFPYNLVMHSFEKSKNVDAMIYRFGYLNIKPINILRQNIDNLQNKLGSTLNITRTAIPIDYPDMPAISGMDIVIHSKVGRWSKYKEWPFFDEFKEELYKRNVSYIDAADILKRYGTGIKGSYACLNYVAKSRLCLALDSGFSHLISSVGAGKTFILQSGYTLKSFWSTYDYKFISFPVPCSPCYLSTFHGDKCFNEHQCMRKISVTKVIQELDL
jgi:hypothetical protein